MRDEVEDVEDWQSRRRTAGRFSRSHRLQSKRSIDRVFRAGSYRKRLGVVRVVASPNEIDHPRLAIGVSKRYLRRAVDRNLVKRQIREWFRLNQDAMPAYDLLITYVELNPRQAGQLPADVKSKLKVALARLGDDLKLRKTLIESGE